MLDRPPPLIFPPEFDPIAFIIGWGPSMRLTELNGGAPVWIPHPRWLDHDQLVVDVLGMELARELCEEMGGRYWQPPDYDEAGRFYEVVNVMTWAVDACRPLPQVAEKLDMEVSRVHALLTAVAMWYQTGDLELASRHIGEPPWFLSLALNHSYSKRAF